SYSAAKPCAGAAMIRFSRNAPIDSVTSRFLGSTLGNHLADSFPIHICASSSRTFQGWALWPLGASEGNRGCGERPVERSTLAPSQAAPQHLPERLLPPARASLRFPIGFWRLRNRKVPVASHRHETECKAYDGARYGGGRRADVQHSSDDHDRRANQ